MDVNKRMYYSNQKKLHFDEYEDVDAKFDQVYDDSSNLKMDSRTFNKSVNMHKVDKSQFNEEAEYSKFDDSKIDIEPKLIPETLYQLIKEKFYKNRKYIENKPKPLFSFIKEYRNMTKKSLKVPNDVLPILKYRDADIAHSLEYYYNRDMDLNKTRQDFEKSQQLLRSKNDYKPRFTKSTLKNLYKEQEKSEEQKQKELEIFKSIEKFTERLVVAFFHKRNTWTNDRVQLFDYWKDLRDDEKEKLFLEWEKGDNNLMTALDDYYADRPLVIRVQDIFLRQCSYRSYGVRPLHDMWTKIHPEERFVRGLFVYPPDEFYAVLEKLLAELEKEAKEKAQQEVDNRHKLEEEKIKKQKMLGSYVEEKKKSDKTLWEPKDKWQTGKAMLKLNKQFNFDNILQKMIKQEFIENRKFKFPEEYAVYDEDEENARKRIIFDETNKKHMTEEEKVQRIKEKMLRFKDNDDQQQITIKKDLRKEQKENHELDRYLKGKCISFMKIIQSRLETKENGSINKFISSMYTDMKANHKNATYRLFPRFEEKWKTKKMKNRKRFNNYPLSLKIYFFNLLRQLKYDYDEGKFKFGKKDILAFWAPSMSNGCKAHKNYCPLYCRYNSHNKYVKTQREVNFHKLYPVPELNQGERLNLWKRSDSDIYKEKNKIFLCLSEVEHCTFEPRVNIQKLGLKAANKPEEVINKRISNKEWVDKMGKDFRKSFPLIHKDGKCKKAKIYYQNGDFTNARKIIEENFNVDLIKCYFDKKFEASYKKKKREEEEREIMAKEREKLAKERGYPIEKENDNNNNDKFFENRKKYEAGGNTKGEVIHDDFTDPKNLQICEEVYQIIMDIEGFKKERKQEAKRIEEEIKMIESIKRTNRSVNLKNSTKSPTKGTSLSPSKVTNVSPSRSNVGMNNTLNNMGTKSSLGMKNTMAETKLMQTNYIKDRYFKLFKSLMCPLKEDCPNDLRPRWPHTGIKSNTPFGLKCPYAHHVSELKFEQEINQKIKLKKNHMEILLKDADPIIKEWIPAGPIISCTGCGKSYTLEPQLKSTKATGNKGLCGFCRYSQHNNLINEKERKASSKANEQILKNINYKAEKPEDWDMDFTNKFGMLQKANVLYNFRRYIDSLEVIGKAKTMVDHEQKENDVKFNTIRDKWKKKLEILDVKINKDIFNYAISQDVLDHFEIKTPLSTFLIFVEKVRKGADFSIYNRHTFLNNQIVEFYHKVERAINSYKTDIRHIKKQIGEIDKFMERKDKLKVEDPNLFKKYSLKSEMCPNIVKTGKCPESYRDCKYAHSSVQLNKCELKTQKTLLKSNMAETQKKIHSTTTMPSWKPPKRGYFERVRPNKQLILKRLERAKRSHSEKKYKSVDIKKLKIDFHEV